MNKILDMSCFSSKKPEKFENEDSYLPPSFDKDFNIVFAIADGVGSSENAILASYSAIKAVKSVIDNDFFSIESAFEAAKSEIDNIKTNSATTLTVVHVKEHEISIGHIGDCRVYFSQGNKLIQMTRDHTKYQEILESGEHKLKNLRNHKERLSSVLTNALSSSNYLHFDVVSMPIDMIKTNGVFQLFVMSDGAYKHWDARPRFSSKTMNSPASLSNSLKKRIEKKIIDDYTFIGVKIASGFSF